MIDLCAKERKEAFGKRVAKERKKVGLTQSKLAERLGNEIGREPPKQSTISMWETGDSFPESIETIFALSRIFGCDCGYLLGDYDERTFASMDICKATGLSEETINTLCNLRAWGGDRDLCSAIDALVYDYNHATKGEDISPLAYLISWFLRFDGKESRSKQVFLDGNVADCTGGGYIAGALRLNDRIIENAALTEIQQGLISLKKRILRKERAKNGITN